MIKHITEEGSDIFSGPLETAAEGFRFLEGPVWNPVQHHLVFSDIIGNALYQMDRSGKISMIRRNSFLANGNTYDRSGRLITCEHGTSRLTRLEHDGSVTVLASRWNDKELNSPNDVIVKSDGSIYFTDPASGRGEGYGIPRKQELDFQGVYRLDPETLALTLLADDFSKPNGLCFTPDESHLLVNDTDRQHIRRFPVYPDGTLGEGELFAELVQDAPGAADGMKFDSQHRLFCCAPGGIQVFSREGKLICRLFIPKFTANFTWGDEDLKTLYITASSALYRIRVTSPGFKLF